MVFEELSDDEIRKPTSYNLTVLTKKTEFKEEKTDLNQFREDILKKLKENYLYKLNKGSFRKEGLVDFNSSENIIECIFVREGNTLIRDVDETNLRLIPKHITVISSSNMVKIKINLDKNRVDTSFYGGSRAILSKAIDIIGTTIKTQIIQHKTYDSAFKKEEMRKILESFGDDIDLISIGPGDSKKLKKVQEQQGKLTPFKIEYSASIHIVGIKVNKAPLVKTIIDEEGISIKEIEGKILYSSKKIKCKVNSSGRIQLIIPNSIVSNKAELNTIGAEIYKRIIENKIKKSFTPSLDNFTKEES